MTISIPVVSIGRSVATRTLSSGLLGGRCVHDNGLIDLGVLLNLCVLVCIGMGMGRVRCSSFRRSICRAGANAGGKRDSDHTEQDAGRYAHVFFHVVLPYLVYLIVSGVVQIIIY